MSVRNASITETLVKAAWRKTGLELFNPNIFGDLDFAPSHNSSIHGHVPSSFPNTELNTHRESSPGTTPSSSVSPDNPPTLLHVDEVAADEDLDDVPDDEYGQDDEEDMDIDSNVAVEDSMEVDAARVPNKNTPPSSTHASPTSRHLSHTRSQTLSLPPEPSSPAVCAKPHREDPPFVPAVID